MRGDVRDVVEIFETADGWRWERVDVDGEVVGVSQRFFETARACLHDALDQNRDVRTRIRRDV